MYLYNQWDQAIVDDRVTQFRDQTRRYLAGELSEDEFRPLRLQNGLYVQRYAPMLRIAVPYGLLSSQQLRKLAQLARCYDRGYGHFSTRQNMQLNWPNLADVPEILAELATVQMHAIQTSGNCIRNTTTDHFAGAIAGEIEDPRPWCELIRQWSTFHPEFAWLPRKFKIAVNAHHSSDRAATAVHDIGVSLVQNDQGETGFRILVGGGLGRTPMVGAVIRDFLPKVHLLSYLDAVLRVYNLHGRRDNKYKARIKILVKALTPEVFAQKVEAEWLHLKDGPTTLTDSEIARVKQYFIDPAYKTLPAQSATLLEQLETNSAFRNWYRHNTTEHKRDGYRIVTLSLKRTGTPPGDASSEQMEAVADLADAYSFAELRVSHEQNLILANVEQEQLFGLWQKLTTLGFATANIDTINNIICCPGGDFCSLANAKSIPIAEHIQRRFSDMDTVYDLGEIDLNISGCMNACGHHHVGHIGILGVDKKGEEYYQISLGGNSGKQGPAAIGNILGPSVYAEEVADTIDEIIQVFLDNRQGDERFIDTFHRIGIEKFRERVYA